MHDGRCREILTYVMAAVVDMPESYLRSISEKGVIFIQ